MRVAAAVVALWPALAGADAGATIAVAGDAAATAVTVGGQAVRLPAVDVALDADGELLPGARDNLRRRDGAPVRFRAAVRWVEGAPRAWTLTLEQVLPDARPVRVLGGAGAPDEIVWDGNDATGKPVAAAAVYEVQLRVSGDDGSVAASPRRRFGIGWGISSREKAAVWRGDLFAGEPLKPQATPELGREVMALARGLQGGEGLVVEVHDDGSGDKLEKLASTQKQAELVRVLLRAAGVDPARVRARGRGNMAMLGPARTAAQRRQNRRVVVTTVTAMGEAGGGAVPPPDRALPQAFLAGKAVAVDGAGRFRVDVPVPPDGRVLVELAAADGRATTRPVLVGRAARAPAEPRVAVLAGDVAARTLSAAQVPLDTAVLGVDVALGEPVAVATRLVLRPVIPDELRVADWELLIWAGDRDEGEPAARFAGVAGPPATLSWDGARGAARVAFRLRVNAADGSRGASPLYVADRALVPAVGGPLFSATGDPQPPLRKTVDAVAGVIGERPAGERYRLEMTSVLPADFNAAEIRLALGARVGRVRALLEVAGVAQERVDVEVAAAGDRVAAHERLVCTAVRAVGPGAARVLLDGKELTLDGSGFRAIVVVGGGKAAHVEMLTAEGRSGSWVIGEGALQLIPKVPDLKEPGVRPVRAQVAPGGGGEKIEKIEDLKAPERR